MNVSKKSYVYILFILNVPHLNLCFIPCFKLKQCKICCKILTFLHKSAPHSALTMCDSKLDFDLRNLQYSIMEGSVTSSLHKCTKVYYIKCTNLYVKVHVCDYKYLSKILD